METNGHTNALSSQLVQTNHWSRPNTVTVAALVHELFLKVSTCPAKLTWLGLLSKPNFFRTKKEGGKHPTCFWIIGNFSWAKHMQTGDLKTRGILCQTTGTPPAWETCLWTLPDRAQHQCLQVSLHTVFTSCVTRSYGSITFFKVIRYRENQMQVKDTAMWRRAEKPERSWNP